MKCSLRNGGVTVFITTKTMDLRFKMAAKVLPIVRIQDKEYFVDLRLGQFREVQNPYEYINFDTSEGKVLLEYVPLVECQHCGFRAVVSKTNEELSCMKCRGRVWMF